MESQLIVLVISVVLIKEGNYAVYLGAIQYKPGWDTSQTREGGLET